MYYYFYLLFVAAFFAYEMRSIPFLISSSCRSSERPSKPAHDLHVLLLAHLVICLTYLSQDFEVIDVERRRERVEELGFFVCRI